MTDHGFKMVSLSSIRTNAADIRARMGRPDVAELAQSRKKIALHPVTVQLTTGDLIAGRDRYAADLLNKTKRVYAHFVTADVDETLDLEIEENLHRRADNRDELVARRVRRVAAEAIAEAEEVAQNDAEFQDKLSGKSGPNTAPHRPKSAKGLAREKVARELGTSPEAVRKAESRAAKPAPAVAAPAEAPPPIDMFGKTAPSEWLAKVREVQAAIDAADKAGRAMQAALTKLDGLPFRGALLQRLQRAAHELTAELRAARPLSLCTYCDETHATCPVCCKMGWIGADALPPEDLRAHKPAAGGGEKTGGRKGAGAAWVSSPAPRKPALAVTLVGPDGLEVPFADVPDPTDADAPADDEAF